MKICKKILKKIVEEYNFELGKDPIKSIYDNADKVSWVDISYYQTLSEDFIREFKDKVNWSYISYNQKLSEDFIREFQDKVNWINISYNQTLSEDFQTEFRSRL